MLLREKAKVNLIIAVKNLCASAGNAGSKSGRSLEGGHGNPLPYLAWRVPRTDEPGGLQSIESQRVRHD